MRIYRLHLQSMFCLNFSKINSSLNPTFSSKGFPLVSVTDKQTEYRRLQGILQGRSGEDRLAIDGRTEKALPDTLGHAGLGENVDVPTTTLPASEHKSEDHDQRGEAREPSWIRF